MKMTVKEFAASEGCSEVEANAILRFLAERGYAREGKVKTAKRGRPASIFTMKQRGTLNMVKSA